MDISLHTSHTYNGVVYILGEHYLLSGDVGSTGAAAPQEREERGGVEAIQVGLPVQIPVQPQSFSLVPKHCVKCLLPIL